MCDIDNFPVDMIDDIPIVCPEAVIQLALSTFRHSGYSDKQIAEHIGELLAFIMAKNKIIIDHRDISLTEVKRFRRLSFEKKK